MSDPATPKKNNKRSDRLSESHLLTTRFPSKKGGLVRLVTYDGQKDVEINKLHRYDLIIKDAPNIRKNAVLLAFPAADMDALKVHIKRRKEVADEKLEPIEKKQDRPHIDFTVNHRGSIEIVLRNGLVMSGVIAWINRYNIVLKLGKHLVLIYKHGVYSFQRVKSKETLKPRR